MADTPEIEIECPICGELVKELVALDGEETTRAALMCEECRLREEEEAVERERERQDGLDVFEEQKSEELLDQLTQHIDHDSPPGLGARQLASLILQVTAGIGGKEASLLADEIRTNATRLKEESSDV